jgi:hypothetical protein
MTNARCGLFFIAWILATSAATAASQQVFRCGPDGRVYSQTPCKDGYEVKADDARSAEQRKAAEEIAGRDRKSTEKMTRERQAREAAAAVPGVGVIANPAAAKPAATAASAAKIKKRPPAGKPAQP